MMHLTGLASYKHERKKKKKIDWTEGYDKYLL